MEKAEVKHKLTNTQLAIDLLEEYKRELLHLLEVLEEKE